MTVNDAQVGGTHYRTGYQHWDFMARNFGSSYFKGCATKYVMRWRQKNGVEDLKKSIHYIQKLQELTLDGIIDEPYEVARNAAYFCTLNCLPKEESYMVRKIFEAKTARELDDVLVLLEDLITKADDIPF